MQEYMTEAELAEALKVSRTFLWEMRATEGLPFCRLRKLIRYRPEEVMEWLSKHGAPLAPLAEDDCWWGSTEESKNINKEIDHE